MENLSEDGGEKVFFSCRQNVSIDVPKYIYAKSSLTSYRLQKYKYYITCIVYAYLQHVCKQILCEFFYSFICQVSEAFVSGDISISVRVPLLRPAMRYLLCWCWDVADWVLPNAALCHSAKWSSGHLWSAQPNCAQTTPDI